MGGKWGQWRDWQVLIQYGLIGVLLPSAAFRLIYGSFDLDTDGKEVVAGFLSLVGFLLFVWARHNEGDS